MPSHLFEDVEPAVAARAPSEMLKPPQERSYWNVLRQLQKGNDVCFQSPTGSGKTTMAYEWLQWALSEGKTGIFYVNRKSLVTQTYDRFTSLGMGCGVRAADCEDLFNQYEEVQIASADTERVRVYGDKAVWPRHDSNLVIVDEAHIQKSMTMQAIVADHKDNGAQIVLMSATPVNLLTDMGPVTNNLQLVTGGTIQEFRDCGLMVPAVVETIEQPDMSKVKRNKDGEYVMDGKKKMLFTQQIVGDVIGNWKKYNNGEPTFAYWPGKPESRWGTKQFEDAGIPWAHVDSTEIYMDGKYIKRTRNSWEDLLGRYKDGKIQGISSRFVLREGVDAPHTSHIILGTPIGNLSSFLQTVGRGMRACPDRGKNLCLIQCHGGNYWNHGSPNADRPWELLWQMSNARASSLHQYEIKHGERDEPIRCGECGRERTKGRVCPHCGYESALSVRKVRMANGELTTKEGKMAPRKHVKLRKDTQRKWDKMYWGFKRKNLERSFVQLEAFFVQENGYWPPRTLNNMPFIKDDWHRKVYAVDVKDIRTEKQPERIVGART